MQGRPATPLADAVLAARSAGLKPMQIPGHKHRYNVEDGDAPGNDLLHPFIRDDIPLQGAADDNHYSNDWLGQAERLYATAIGADFTRFLVNGGTQGNLTAMLAVGGDGISLMLDRTAHRSVLAGLILSGSTPVWIYPERHPELGLPIGMRGSAISGAGVSAGEVAAVLATSPSYVGTLSRVPELVTAAHAIEAPLIVDQAWGAHLDFNVPGYESALKGGADLVVTSIHKALLGYTQTAIISGRGELIGSAAVARALDLTSTTSPSGTLLASIDATRAFLERDGESALESALTASREARAILRRVPGVVVVDDEIAGCAVDPLKLVLWLPRCGVLGTDIGQMLWAAGRGVEATDADTVVMTVTIADDPAEVIRSAEMLAGMIESLRSEPRVGMPASVWAVRPTVALTPRAAAFSPRERIPLKSAVGRISAEQFTPYPPGVPLVGPGEVITEEVIAAIGEAGRVGRVAYCSDPSLTTVEVVVNH